MKKANYLYGIQKTITIIKSYYPDPDNKNNIF